MKNKIQKANQIVKDTIAENYPTTSWRYIDFVQEDRFVNEVVSDEKIDLKNWSAVEMAEYALEQINVTHPIELSSLHLS